MCAFHVNASENAVCLAHILIRYQHMAIKEIPFRARKILSAFIDRMQKVWDLFFVKFIGHKCVRSNLFVGVVV